MGNLFLSLKMLPGALRSCFQGKPEDSSSTDLRFYGRYTSVTLTWQIAIFICGYLDWQWVAILSILHSGCADRLRANSFTYILSFADFQSIGFFIVPNVAALEEKWRSYSSWCHFWRDERSLVMRFQMWYKNLDKRRHLHLKSKRAKSDCYNKGNYTAMQ